MRKHTRIMRLMAFVIPLVLLGCFMPMNALADASLQLNPLRYDDVISGTAAKSGFIDVSNPSDTSVSLATSVKGFRQVDLDGNLAFFNDAQLSEGIKPGLGTFELGPRESVRVVFSVDPLKLPAGGVYAAIFFTTVPPPATTNLTYIAETANVGTLLLLQNGGSNSRSGDIQKFSLPWLQLGNALTGSITYYNTNRNVGGLAFTPRLTSTILPWGHAQEFDGSLVLPSAKRNFIFHRPGSYIGLLPVTLRDASGSSRTTWTLACTGWFRWLTLSVLAVLLFVGAFKAWLRHKYHS